MEDEDKFQQWIRALPWFQEFKREYGQEPDLNSNSYDYRSAFRAGIIPQPDPYDSNRYHWPSVNPTTGQELKALNHPTAWMEDYMRITGGVDPRSPDKPSLTPEQIRELGQALIRRYSR